MIAKGKKGKGKKQVEEKVFVAKEDCPECLDLPEGEVYEGHDHTVPVEPIEEIQENFIDEEPTPPDNLHDPKYSDFVLKRLVMQNGRWEMHLDVKKNFDKVYHKYIVEMTVDVSALDWRIEEKKKAKARYEAENQMDAFEEMKKRELEEYDHRIEALVTERAERISSSPKISFEAEVVATNTKSYPAKLVLWIPHTAIDLLNAQRNLMENYKLELIKNLSND